MPSEIELEQSLIGPGGGFEVAVEDVGGVPMKVYKDRMRSLGEIPRLASFRGDDSTFIVYEDQRIGYGTFVATADAIGVALGRDLGVARGERVAVLSANNPEWCLSFWATVGIGAILVGLNGWWTTDEILYGINDSGSKVLIADRERFERVREHLSEIPSVERIFVIGLQPDDYEHDQRIRPFSELVERGSESGIHQVDVGEDDPAVIFYTSGTTGRPKGAISTHRSMIANLQNTFYGVVFSAMSDPDANPIGSGGEQPASLITAPFFHVTGCHSGLVVGMAAGLKLVMLSGKFESTKALRLIQDEHVVVWTGVPTTVWRVVDDPSRAKYDLSSVRTVGYGGSPSGAELQRRVREAFPNVRMVSNAYGLTESSSAVTMNSGEGSVKYPGSVGRPFPIVDVRINDLDDKEAPAGSIGEIWIRGPQIMPGYWNRPDATGEVIEDGWLKTGDIGYLNEDNYLFITDRARDMIIRGGENIYSVEIENRLEENPSISEVAVVGVPHPTLGEEVKAVIRVEPGMHLTQDEARSWVAEKLAPFKVPSIIEISNDYLPRNASGKVLKNLLRGEDTPFFEES